MRAPTLAAFVVALGIGGAFGWTLRGEPKTIVKTVERPIRVAVAPKPRPMRFPDYPKPPFELPAPEPEPPSGGSGAPMPSVIVGELPSLPTAGPGALAPEIPTGPTTVADIHADEALARRLVLQAGGEVVSSADAKDASGNVGRSLVAETATTARDGLRAALRQSLGDRVVLSDGGSVSGTSPELQKAEADLATARKARDKARLDFMPEAPALRQIEEDYAKQEKALADLRKLAARARLNILIRPVLSS